MPMERGRPVQRSIRVHLLLLGALVALAGCKTELPAPLYPAPEDPPLEETELWPYFEEPGSEEEADGAWQEEDENWDEGEEDAAPATEEPSPP